MAEHLVDVRVDQLSVECGIEVIFSILPFQCGGVGLNGLDSTRLDHIITNGPSLCVSKLFMRCAPHQNIIGGSSVNHLAMESDCPSRLSMLSIKHKLQYSSFH